MSTSTATKSPPATASKPSIDAAPKSAAKIASHMLYSLRLLTFAFLRLLVTLRIPFQHSYVKRTEIPFGYRALFYQSAFSSMRSAPESRAFYDRKRSEGKRHTQAVIALARRRVNVLWAMLRDGATFEARSAA